MNIVFATCLIQPTISSSDQVFAEALEQCGAKVSGAAWNAKSKPFLSADGVIIRATWDYFDHYPQFITWLDLLQKNGIRVLNSLDILRWNVHKSYLFDLQEAGAPVLPMVAVENRVESIQRAAQENGWSNAVLKCLVSGTARGLSLFDASSAQQIEQAIEVAKPWSEFGLVVQPFMSEIKSAGELSMVFIEGELAHAVQKIPKADEFRIQSVFGGQYERVEPSEQSLRAAKHCLSCVENRFNEQPLYARVDGLVVDGAFQLMELELAEPELMFNLAPDAARTMAVAVMTRWQQESGLH